MLTFNYSQKNLQSQALINDCLLYNDNLSQSPSSQDFRKIKQLVEAIADAPASLRPASRPQTTAVPASPNADKRLTDPVTILESLGIAIKDCFRYLSVVGFKPIPYSRPPN